MGYHWAAAADPPVFSEVEPVRPPPLLRKNGAPQNGCHGQALLVRVWVPCLSFSAGMLAASSWARFGKNNKEVME